MKHKNARGRPHGVPYLPLPVRAWEQELPSCHPPSRPPRPSSPRPLSLRLLSLPSSPPLFPDEVADECGQSYSPRPGTMHAKKSGAAGGTAERTDSMGARVAAHTRTFNFWVARTAVMAALSCTESQSARSASRRLLTCLTLPVSAFFTCGFVSSAARSVARQEIGTRRRRRRRRRRSCWRERPLRMWRGACGCARVDRGNLTLDSGERVSHRHLVERDRLGLVVGVSGGFGCLVCGEGLLQRRDRHLGRHGARAVCTGGPSAKREPPPVGQEGELTGAETCVRGFESCNG